MPGLEAYDAIIAAVLRCGPMAQRRLPFIRNATRGRGIPMSVCFQVAASHKRFGVAHQCLQPASDRGLVRGTRFRRRLRIRSGGEAQRRPFVAEGSMRFAGGRCPAHPKSAHLRLRLVLGVSPVSRRHRRGGL